MCLRSGGTGSQPAGANMFVGEKVYIEGNGEGARRAAGELIALSVILGNNGGQYLNRRHICLVVLGDSGSYSSGKHPA